MKFYDEIAFVTTEETAPGVWEEVENIRKYPGDVLVRSSRYQQAQQVNEDVCITNEISIVADQFANNNFYNIRWIRFAGAKWKVTNVSVEPPRLKLSTGGLYNG